MHGVDVCTLAYALATSMYCCSLRHVMASGLQTWFHVSVKVAMLVDVGKPLQNLMHPASYPGFWNKLVTVLCELIQIAVLQAEPICSTCGMI